MIMHMDMDAFFASVEQLDNPDLAGKPIAVGGNSERGVVSTASYEARKFGVRSAMPVLTALSKCPGLILVPGRRKRYSEISQKIMHVLSDFSPVVEQVSIDEAYIDISGLKRIGGTPEEIGQKVRNKVHDTTGLTCSVGIAPLRFLAKIASDMNKPDGLTLISEEMMMDFIEQLPIKKIPGVGQKTITSLTRMNIKYLGDVRKYPLEYLIKRLGKFGKRLWELSRGIDDVELGKPAKSKSISTEITLQKDTLNKVYLKNILLMQAEEIGRELRKKKFRAKTVILKIKHSDFKQITRSHTLVHPTDSSDVIFKEVNQLFENYTLSKKVRLIGFGVTGLITPDTPVQTSIFTESGKKEKNWGEIEKTMDSISGKFGNKAVLRASLKKIEDDE